MNILMLGWEFPPFKSGGLGTACEGLTKGLVNNNVNVTFVLPKAKSIDANSHVKLIAANKITGVNKKNLRIIEVSSLLVPYINSEQYNVRIKNKEEITKGALEPDEELYGKNLYEEVYKYAQKVQIISESEQFDVIHAHDWMTYPAGINAMKKTKKPLVVHIHATEFDRTCGNVNQVVYDIEKEGFHQADKIIAVSNFTKERVVKHYGVDPKKVEVVHNAVEFNKNYNYNNKEDNKKTVLYLGRITMQKGPEYFLYSAKQVLEKDKNVNFVFAGSGPARTLAHGQNPLLGDPGGYHPPGPGKRPH